MFKGIVFDLDGTLLDSKLCFDRIRDELDIPQGEFILEYLETIACPQTKANKRRDKYDYSCRFAKIQIPS